jgi:subtilisin family serine protease
MRRVWLALACLSSLALASSAHAQPTALREGALAMLERHASVEVLINLVGPSGSFQGRGERSAIIERDQDEVLGSLCGQFSLTRRYRHVPALAGTITRAGITLLENDRRVQSIQVDGRGGGQLAEAVPAIGGDRARTMFNVSGKGILVAVLDTGVDTDHPDLMAAIVAQHCFTNGACRPFLTSESTSGEDDHGHGSNVAGIVASRGKVASLGFAPDAKLVVVKVNDRNNFGRESDWLAGLDWVYDQLAISKVQVVNLSLGTNALYTGNCDADEPGLAAAVKNLTDAGVSVFAASGNRGSPSMLAAPACNTGVIAVGATYDSDAGFQPPLASSYAAKWGHEFADCADADSRFDQITCFTNSNAELDIVAPGAAITSDSLGGGIEMYSGTSQASPVAAGVAALMLQCNQTMKPLEVEQVMKRTGAPRMDAKNGMVFPSLRAFEAVQAACAMAGTDSGGIEGTGTSAGGDGAQGPIAGSQAGVPVGGIASPSAIAGPQGVAPGGRSPAAGSDATLGIGTSAGGARAPATSAAGTVDAPGGVAMGRGSRRVEPGDGCSYAVAGGRASGKLTGLWLLACVACWLSRRTLRAPSCNRREL